MRLSIVGTGYVGLVSGVCLAELGHQVTCVDIDQEKVDRINQGIPPIYEEGLEVLLKKNIHKTLNASIDLAEAVMASDITMIAVGTPYKGEQIDLTYIKQVAQQIGEVLKSKDSYHLVVVKSTVIPGTTDDVVLPLLEKYSNKKAGVDFGVGMNPEFLREGQAISDFMQPDRIVIGGIDQKSLDVLDKFYNVFKVDILKTNCKTAEMIKYASNSLFATMISFSNEIGNLCEKIEGVDIKDVTRGIHLDKRLTPTVNGQRITPNFTTFIEAGCGFGGSCFPKDVRALVAYGKQHAQPMQLLNSVVDINYQQHEQILKKIHKNYQDISSLKVAILGLAFKPGTDDVRESPALFIVEKLLYKVAKIKAHDPIAIHEFKKIFPNQLIDYCETHTQAIDQADVIIILTSWPEYLTIPSLISNRQDQPLVIDGRRMLERDSVSRYEGIGLY